MRFDKLALAVKMNNVSSLNLGGKASAALNALADHYYLKTALPLEKDDKKDDSHIEAVK